MKIDEGGAEDDEEEEDEEMRKNIRGRPWERREGEMMNKLNEDDDLINPNVFFNETNGKNQNI